MLRFACLFMVLAVCESSWAADVSGTSFSGRVVRVLDGDTLILEGDRRVRLLDINTPELSHDGEPAEAGAAAAADALRRLTFGQDVRVVQGPQAKDRFDRLLGQVYLSSGGWVNGTLVRDGYAHVYTFADNALHPQELLAYEAQARAAKKGIWAQPRWAVRDATKCCAKSDIGTFQLVQGKVLSAMFVKKSKGGRTYLNFGEDWRTDFSVFVDSKDAKWFKKAGIANIADHYRGKTVRVRGHLQPVNGVLVRVTHPAQVEILD
ncbi:MAG: nuclease [Pseudomonas fluorescens]|nr:MAG: nuclease [Pseudomonas fluorescens]